MNTSSSPRTSGFSAGVSGREAINTLSSPEHADKKITLDKITTNENKFFIMSRHPQTVSSCLLWRYNLNSIWLLGAISIESFNRLTWGTVLRSRWLLSYGSSIKISLHCCPVLPDASFIIILKSELKPDQVYNNKK